MEIRAARSDEARKLVEYRVRLGIELMEGDPSVIDATVERWLPGFAELMREEVLFGWFAMDAATYAGSAVLLVRPSLPALRHPHRGFRDGRVHSMFVDPPYRRRGVGKALMQALMAHARDLRLGRVTLGPSEVSGNFYQALGFAPMNDLVYELR